VPTPDASLLADLEVGAGGRIARIADTDPEMLRYFDSVGIALDRTVVIRELRPFAGTIEISIDEGTPIDLGDIAARAIWLVTA
jgi:DtxR family Mn-dependent transcriptional regulator